MVDLHPYEEEWHWERHDAQVRQRVADGDSCVCARFRLQDINEDVYLCISSYEQVRERTNPEIPCCCPAAPVSNG